MTDHTQPHLASCCQPEFTSYLSPPYRKEQAPASGPLHVPLSFPGTLSPFILSGSYVNATLSGRFFLQLYHPAPDPLATSSLLLNSTLVFFPVLLPWDRLLPGLLKLLAR